MVRNIPKVCFAFLQKTGGVESHAVDTNPTQWILGATPLHSKSFILSPLHPSDVFRPVVEPSFGIRPPNGVEPRAGQSGNIWNLFRQAGRLSQEGRFCCLETNSRSDCKYWIKFSRNPSFYLTNGSKGTIIKLHSALVLPRLKKQEEPNNEIFY